MREELASREGERERFTATFERFGKKSAFKGPPKTTLLMRDIKDARGDVMTDHLWFNLTVELAGLRLRRGDVIAFDGRSASYTKGYRGRREDIDAPAESVDYRLSHPTRIEVVSRSGAGDREGGHLCHATGCTVPVRPELLMCEVHWGMVPREQQKLVLKHYRPGQCDDGNPSREWCQAADQAIASVAAKEGGASARTAVNVARQGILL
jgi:hypothetical protein